MQAQKKTTKIIAPALTVFAVLTVITGVVYPLAMTAIAQATMPYQANGSLIKASDGKVIGSALLGQAFDLAREDYFASRPSATTPPYNAASSGASNLATSNPAFKKAIAARQIAYAGSGPCPADLLCASGSGLDPDISVAAARYQARRVAKARGLSQTQIHALIDSCIIKPQLGILGEPRINILSLNMALDHESKR